MSEPNRITPLSGESCAHCGVEKIELINNSEPFTEIEEGDIVWCPACGGALQIVADGFQAVILNPDHTVKHVVR